jgi:hypothetical protein
MGFDIVNCLFDNFTWPFGSRMFFRRKPVLKKTMAQKREPTFEKIEPLPELSQDDQFNIRVWMFHPSIVENLFVNFREIWGKAITLASGRVHGRDDLVTQERNFLAADDFKTHRTTGADECWRSIRLEKHDWRYADKLDEPRWFVRPGSRETKFSEGPPGTTPQQSVSVKKGRK